MATFDTISSVQLSAGGTAALTITLQRDELADMAEVVDELLIRTHEDTVHVPIAAVRDGRTPSTGEPVEKRSAPSRDEHWDEADDSDDDQAAEVAYASSAHRRASAALRSMGGGKSLVLPPRPGEELTVKLTPARCTDADELEYYKTLLREDMKRQQEAAEAEAAEAEAVQTQAAAAAEAAKAEVVAVAGLSSGFGPSSTIPPSGLAAMPPSPVRVVQISEADQRAAELRAAELCAAEQRARSVVSQVQADAEREDDEELAFYRAFVRGKQNPAKGPDDEAGSPGSMAGSRVWAAGMAAAQAEARQALAAGTYFIINGVVTDSRGRELGSPAEVLGPGYADDPAPISDPARTAGARDLAALHNAGLGALRDVLGKDGPDELESYLGDDAAEMRAVGELGASRLDATVSAPPISKPLWANTGTGARAAPGELTKGLGDSLKIGSPPKGTLKGGGAIVQSTAPRPTKKLTEAEMEANWEKLCAEMG